MKHRATLLSLALAAIGASACVSVSHHDTRVPPGPVAREARRGPPPHAPAHGYRHKQDKQHDGVDLIFDSGLGVYVVVGWPDHYWYGDRYYRFSSGTWMASSHLDGGWAGCAPSGVPAGLREKHARGKNRKSHPASPAR